MGIATYIILGLNLIASIAFLVHITKKHREPLKNKPLETEDTKEVKTKKGKKNKHKGNDYILIDGVAVPYDPTYDNVYNAQLDEKTRDIIERSKME